MSEDASYEVLSPRACKALISDHRDLVIIDVRTKVEHDYEGRLEGSVLIDYLKPRIFKKEVNKLDRHGTYLVYCSVGQTSELACRDMVEYGFEHVISMEGGLKKWQEDQHLVTTVSKLSSEEVIERRKKIVIRISKLEGQIAGIKRMLMDGEYCGDVLNQSLAARAALNGVNKEIMEMFSQHCISSPEQKDDFYRYLNKLI